MDEKDNDEFEVYKDLQLEASNRYFEGEGRTILHLIEGYNQLTSRIPDIFTDRPFETRSGTYRLEFVEWVKPSDEKRTKNISKKPSIRQEFYNGQLWPSDARTRKLSYMAPLRMRVVKVGEKGKEAASDPFEIMSLPVMLRSNLCYLSDSSAHVKGEPHPSLKYEYENDTGGYFINLGREMIILLQDHSIYNRDLVLRVGKKKEFIHDIITIRHKSTTKQVSVAIYYSKKKQPQFLLNYHSLKTNKTEKNGINLMEAFTLLGFDSGKVIKIFELMTVTMENPIGIGQIIALLNNTILQAKVEIDKCKDKIRINDRETFNMNGSEGTNIAYANFLADVFPQTNSKALKAQMLAYMTIRVIRVFVGYDSVDVQNSTSNKQFQTPANIVEKLVQQMWRKIKHNVNEEIVNKNPSNASAIANIIMAKCNITNRFIDSFNTGRWGPDNDPKTGVVEETQRELGIVAIINRLTRIVVPGERKSGSVNPESRMVDPEQTGVVCYYTTPDSEQIGHTRNLAWAARISTEVNPDSIRESIVPQISKFITPMNIKKNKKDGIILINAVPVGWGNVKTVFEEVRNLRRQGKILHLENGEWKPYFELGLGIKDGCLWLNTSSGRGYVPRIIIYTKIVSIGPFNIITRYTKSLQNKNWHEMLMTGVVEYIDPFELQQTVIADLYEDFLQREDILYERMKKLKKLVEDGDIEEAKLLYNQIENDEKNNQKTHLSIDPTEILSLSSAMTPFANRIAGVRLALQAKMITQAIPHQPPQHIHYFGQKYRHLINNTAPLVCTTATARSGQEFGLGEQIIIAFISLQGNQEDSIIWRKGAIDTGKLMVEVYITEEFTEINRGPIRKDIKVPFPKAGEDLDKYAYLDRNGIPYVGEVLKEGQFILPVATYEEGKLKKYLTLEKEYYDLEDGILDLQEMSANVYEEKKRLQMHRWGLSGSNLSQTELLEALIEKKAQKLIEIQTSEEQPRWLDSIVVPPTKKYTVSSAVIFDNDSGDRVARIKLRSLRHPRVADKQNPRASQKATIGQIWQDEDMPFFYEGKYTMTPDVIVNSLALPGRQTNSWFLEVISGFIDAIGGTRSNADAFRNKDIDWLYSRLKEIDYSERTAPMINGRTGEYFGVIDAETGSFVEAKIFIGPSYQTALKHQVQDKGQVRGIGKRDIQTGISTKGRNVTSGVKFGVMEGDAVATHGGSLTIIDRLRDSTAVDNAIICNVCGVVAEFQSPNYFCRRCETTQTDNFSRVKISRATTYMSKVIGTANILMTYKTNTKPSEEESEVEDDEDDEEEEEEEEEFFEDEDDYSDEE